MLKVGLISDTHSGAKTGLTSDPKNYTQEVLLKHYSETIDWMGQLDILIHVADAIDGEDLKSRDIDKEMPEQVEDATELLKMVKAKEYMLLAGTPYHTASGATMWDKNIASMLNQAGKKATYHTKLKLELNDWFYLQARHKIGSSTIPHGRFTAPTKSKVWDCLNSALQSSRAGTVCKLPHLMVFGHVHYWTYAEDAFGAAMTMPCWQAPGSKYGDMMCDGHIDLGAVKLFIGDEGEWSWEKKLFVPKVASRVVKRSK